MKRFIEMSDAGRTVLARMDNICDSLVPSDIRELLGEIDRLKAMVKRLIDDDMGPAKWSRVISDAKQLLSK